MASATESPALKRKREGAESARKKVKTNVKMEDVATPKTPKQKAMNGVHAQEQASSTSRKDKKKGKKEDETPKGNEHLESPSVKSEASVRNVEEKVETIQQPSVQPKQRSKSKKKTKSRWSWRASVGGWFLPQDPVFTADEKHLILSNDRSLQVYEADTSTLVRSISKPSPFVSAYALSASNTNQVYTASATGLISLWDWAHGKIIGRWDIGTHVRSISVIKDPATNMDLVFSHETSPHHVINVHALRTRDQGAQTELKEVFKRKKSTISGFQVLLDGKIVVISVDKSILIGRRSKTHKAALQDYVYVWREFQTSMRITAFDAYARTPSNPEDKTSASSGDRIDLALGDQEGAILLFEDILASFARLEKSRKEGPKSNIDLDMLRPKRLHWHREAVASVKWSRDGNYLISGGAETVLVLWQLSTGKQQHLPHLTAAIENIVVSPSGASYSVRLANNSVIVLSTTELNAKTNVIGVQSRHVETAKIVQQWDPEGYPTELLNKVPMVVDPKNNNQVLFTVPSSQPLKEKAGLRPEPYLQTFDVATQHSVSRQALTRNNATDPNMAPDGKRIKEPNVLFMQVSKDGRWLATVDEWIPPRSDMDYLDEGIAEFNEQERFFRREIYLKFWRWDEKNAQWALESRIDNPHFDEAVGANTGVQDFVADPSSTGFATVGEDQIVRIWKPKTRTKGGVVLRKAADKGEGLVSWYAKHEIHAHCGLRIAESSSNRFPWEVPQNLRLSFSLDGSVLAASVSDEEYGVIHIINASTGGIQCSINASAVSQLGILGRHLIVVGESVAVWDLVSLEMSQCIPLSRIIGTLDASLVRFAINSESNTFAVACPRLSGDNQRFGSTISIFDPSNAKPLWESTHSNSILALASTNSNKSYVALDSTSTLTVVSRDVGVLQLPTPPPEVAPQIARQGQHMLEDEEEIEERGEEGTGAGALDTLVMGDDVFVSENDKPVVTPEQLQQVFEVAPSHAQPPVQDLFHAVIRLYARKPRVPRTSS